MPPDLHLDPDRLRAHAVRAAELADRIPLRPAAPSVPLPAGLVAEHDHLEAALRRAMRELVELGSVLGAVAAAADTAEADAVRALRRAVRP